MLNSQATPPGAVVSVWAAQLAQLNAELEKPEDSNDKKPEWSDQDLVFLHWRLLKEVGELGDPATPLDDKFDMLRWIFTDSSKDNLPFSFVNCLHIVSHSSLSPLPFCGNIDADEIRTVIGNRIREWLLATVARYPEWVRTELMANPDWVSRQLERNPQWINEQIRKRTAFGDLFN